MIVRSRALSTRLLGILVLGTLFGQLFFIMDKNWKRLEECEEKVKYLIETIIPLLKKRNDHLQNVEVLIFSLEALYQKKLRDGQELESI